MINRINIKEFGKIIKSIRIDNNYTQQKLGELSCISTETIRRIENGDNMPKMQLIENLSKVLKQDLLQEFMNTRKNNVFNKFYDELDELIINNDRKRLTEITKEFELVASRISNDSVIEISEIKQFQTILKGLEKSFECNQKGSKDALHYYLTAIRMTIEAFDIRYIDSYKYSHLEFKCLMVISLEYHALSQFQESNRLSLLLMKHICKPMSEQGLTNNLKFRLKLLLNISYNYHCLNQDAKALEYSSRGLLLCKENSSYYLLHALYYRNAVAKYYLKEEEQNYMSDFNNSIRVLDMLEMPSLKKQYITATKEQYNILIE